MVYRKTEGVKAHLAAERKAIIAAAFAVLEKHGELTTTRVCERAGISTGKLYNYFADVDEVMAAVVALALAREKGAMEQANRDADSRYPINAFARALAVFYATLDKPQLARALARELAYRKGIREELEALLARLDFPPRARKERAAAVLGAMYGLSDIEASVKVAIEAGLRVVGVPEKGTAALALAASRR